ncbi:glycerol-3-phosphate dehydrogenase/oxidase [Agromyces neolithicus]|uniref:Glycerol-3-phosphate dehydrogenase n=1 Tax=Agromyces neolithicus TaxID=269420 RepID=A0ABN2LRN6_9MICO
MARTRRAPSPLTTAIPPASVVPSSAAALNAGRRARELDALSASDRPVDVLVIGGGVTGAGVALDAAARGLSVVLAESHDLAFGTSRWSSKLVHGGLRYLATGDVGVARESAAERHLLMTRIAPHLVHPLPQVLPLVDTVTTRQRVVGGIGLGLGDGLRLLAGTPGTMLPRPRRIGRDEVLRLAPATRRHGLRGGLLSYDGQLVDDARLVIALARTAAALGAVVLTRMRATSVGAHGATLTDSLGGGSLRVGARVVVNATGVWASEIDDSIRLRPSRGTHLVLDAAAMGDPVAALTVPHPGSISRYVFALPQQLRRVVVGLTDEDAPGEVPDVPTPSDGEIDFLLATLSRALERQLGRGDVLGSFAGLRPLVDSGEGSTADLSRRHHVAVSNGGIVNVLGGKLTTYRAMAEDAVDIAVRHGALAAGECRTRSLPLVGAPGSPVSAAAPATSTPTAALPPSLVARFGAEAPVVLASARASAPSAPVAPGIDVTRAEVEFAVLAEGALDADDVLDRRTRIGLVAADSERAHDEVAALVDEALARVP